MNYRSASSERSQARWAVAVPILVAYLCVASAQLAEAATAATPSAAAPAATPAAATAPPASAPATWHEQMRRLADTLIDAYPFFFTLKAFRSPENQQTITKLLAQIRTNVHGVPTKQGENLLGDEPLVKRAQKKMEESLTEAEIAFQQKDYDRSQVHIRSAMSKCVACHTAQASNLNFPKTNDEMLNIFTPTQDKAMGLIAIRQFDGALLAIENSFTGRAKFKQTPDQLFNLAKLHLLVSLRTLNQPERARTFLQTAKKDSRLSASSKLSIESWEKSLEAWGPMTSKTPALQLKWIAETISSGAASTTTSPDLNFPLELLRTQLLHKSLTTKLNLKKQAETYRELSSGYAALKLDVLNELSEIYRQACVDISKESAGVKCDIEPSVPATAPAKQ